MWCAAIFEARVRRHSLVKLVFGMVLQRPINEFGGLNLEEQKELGGLTFLKILLILAFTIIALLTMWKC